MPNDDGSLQSVLLAAATLVAVLAGSLFLATRHLTEKEAEATEVARAGCLAVDSCRVASDEVKAAFTDPNACDGAGARVCLVPMGDVSKDIIDMLVEHYRRTYGLTIQVARPIDLREGFDRGTQLEESLLLDQLRAVYSGYASDRSVTLIGLLPVDIYAGNAPSRLWSFGRMRGERQGTGVEYRGGIISTFRLDPANWDLLPDDALRDARIRKMVSKYIALGFYDLPLSNDPGSVTSNLVPSLEQLDLVDERIPVR